MSSALVYPASLFEPTIPPDLGAKAVREKLSKSALTGFFTLVEKWHIRDEDARELLGGLSNGSFYAWKKNPDRVLELDRLTRISYLIGLYKGLHIIYEGKLADEWINLANSNVIFGGRPPLAYMISGGLLAMQTVRSLIDARQGGLSGAFPTHHKPSPI